MLVINYVFNITREIFQRVTAGCEGRQHVDNRARDKLVHFAVSSRPTNLLLGYDSQKCILG